MLLLRQLTLIEQAINDKPLLNNNLFNRQVLIFSTSCSHLTRFILDITYYSLQHHSLFIVTVALFAYCFSSPLLVVFIRLPQPAHVCPTCANSNDNYALLPGLITFHAPKIPHNQFTLAHTNQLNTLRFCASPTWPTTDYLCLLPPPDLAPFT
jgi:hypothetical protein